MKIEMYSKDNCSQCVTAAQWLSSQGFPMETLKLDIDFDRDTLLSIFPRARSYPQFSVNGEPIGDFSSLKASLAFTPETVF